MLGHRSGRQSKTNRWLLNKRILSLMLGISLGVLLVGTVAYGGMFLSQEKESSQDVSINSFVSPVVSQGLEPSPSSDSSTNNVVSIRSDQFWLKLSPPSLFSSVQQQSVNDSGSIKLQSTDCEQNQLNSCRTVIIHWGNLSTLVDQSALPSEIEAQKTWLAAHFASETCGQYESTMAREAALFEKSVVVFPNNSHAKPGCPSIFQNQIAVFVDIMTLNKSTYYVVMYPLAADSQTEQLLNSISYSH